MLKKYKKIHYLFGIIIFIYFLYGKLGVLYVQPTNQISKNYLITQKLNIKTVKAPKILTFGALVYTKLSMFNRLH